MLLQEQDGAVLILTLNRPEVHNAISVDVAEAIATAVEAAGDDESVNVVVIRGSGKSFSAGYDMGTGSYGTRSLDDNVEHLQGLSNRWARVLLSPLPVIAQVHGYCLAGGTDLAGHCDLVLVADDAKIGFPAVRSMGVALTQMWIYHVGPQWAKRLLLTGDSMTGRMAAEIGFALQSVPAAELEAETMRLAHHMALVARDMLIANKRVINHGLDLMGREELQAFAARADAIAHGSPAAQAFAEHARTDGLRAALRHRDEPFGSDLLDVGP
ncbi:crotonase/enoyl-CoA hydratase family protein [Sporichthya brevicatena]|uniref:Crotonase/enoyl-CoA hydratase family protein n=1 Tax=Sporichthya brevicatena TaxID=171442 RepID=A0ABN1GYM7_9ACTN